MPTLATLPPSPLTLCLLGTGNMGLPMARRLAQAGYPMRVWNRTQAKAEVLAADGAVICTTPRQACSGADITLSLLENGDVVEQVLFGLGADSACHGLASGSRAKPVRTPNACRRKACGTWMLLFQEVLSVQRRALWQSWSVEMLKMQRKQLLFLMF